MANRWRGFAKEKHTGLKIGMTVVSAIGFAAAWLGFAGTHPQATAQAAASTPAPAPEQQVVPQRPFRGFGDRDRDRGGDDDGGLNPSQAQPGGSSSQQAPVVPSVPRARRSRGS